MHFQEYYPDMPDGFDGRLSERFMQLLHDNAVRQTHYVAGRFENSYVALADMPEIQVLLDKVLLYAADWLAMTTDQLRIGFWFNAMGPGQSTMMHDHDEDDELLSAVYYLRVPESSGELVLHAGEQRLTVQPRTGKLVLFAPQLPHEVTVNQSDAMRLSIAMNVGPVEA